MNNFLDVARELYDNPTSDLDDGERELFREVFDFKQAMSRAREKMKIDLDNIEKLFGLVEMQLRLKHAPAKTRNATVYLIAKTIQLALKAHGRRGRIGWQLSSSLGDPSSFPPNVECDTTNSRYFADIYDFFAALIAGRYDSQERRRWREDTVITFNYDLVLDDALWRVGFRPEYHLKEAEIEGDQAPLVSILKLHGSTNWQVCSECKHVVISRSKTTGFPLDYRSRTCHKCNKGHFQLLLVPPSWDKTEHQDLMRPVWEAASEALNKATRICIIGYSMPEADAFFQYLITLGLADNHQLYKLIVVNMDGGEMSPSIFSVDEPRCAFEALLSNRKGSTNITVEERYRELFEATFASRRFHYFGHGFEMFLGNGYALPQLGRGELLSNLQMFGG